MQVFKAFFKILKRNKLGMLIYTVVFFVLAIAMSKNGEKNSISSFTQVSLDIGIDNQDEGELGKELKDYLSKENKIINIPKDKEKLLDEMYYGSIEYVLVIPEDFTERFLAGQRDGVLEGTKVPGSSNSYLAEMEIDEFLTTLGMYVDGGYDVTEAAELAITDMQKESHVEFLSKDNAKTVPAGAYYFQFIPYIFVCVMILSLSVILMSFNKKDVDARNKCSAMSFSKRNGQMILGSMCLMLLEYGVFMLAACVLYPDYMWSVRGVMSAVNALVFMLVCVSIAFFLGRLIKNSGQLNMISNVVGLGLSFLGGVFVPLELMGEGTKQVAKFIPSYWYITANESIYKMDSFQDIGTLYQNFFVMGVFAVAILAVALMVNRLKARTA